MEVIVINSGGGDPADFGSQVAIPEPSWGYFRRIVARIYRQPLFLSQMLSSGAGALSMIIGAAFMQQDQFTRYSLLILVSNSCTGAVHSFLFQPALIEFRNNRDSHIHLRLAALGALCASLVFAVVAYAVGVRNPTWLVVLSGASALPIIADWIKMRAISLDRRWDVAAADGGRLVVTLLGCILIWFERDAEPFFLFISLSWLATIALLSLRLTPVQRHLQFNTIVRPAASQLADFAVGQFTSTVPLLILAGLGSSHLIAGVRIAQTLLGPLNMIFAAMTVNLLADGATRGTHADDKDLIRHGRRLAMRLSAAALLLVSAVAATLWATGFSLSGADNRSLTIGTLLVGVLAVFSGFAGIDAIVLRLLGHHVLATVGRVVLVSITGGGYLAGYLIGGVDYSLVIGFIVAAFANPIAFVVPASVAYRRH